MIRKIDDKAKDSAFQRAIAKGAKVNESRVEPDTAATVLADKDREGWDPYEVWLHRVERPRRRRRE